MLMYCRIYFVRYIVIKIYLDLISSMGGKTRGKNNLLLHHVWTSADICDNRGDAKVDGGGFT